jgi:hypothetical protein
MKRTPTVFPEVLAGEQGQGWHVEPHLGGDGVGDWTDGRAKQMGVPLDPEVQAQNIRAHELGHAKWTPTRSSPTTICKRHGISMEALQRAEDLRVGYGLIDSGVDSYALGALSEADFAALRKEGPVKRLAFAVVSSAMTRDRDRIIELAEEVGGPEVGALVRQVAAAAEEALFHMPRSRYRRKRRSPIVPFRRTIEVARLLDQLFPGPQPKPQRHKPQLREGAPRWGEMTIQEPPRQVLARVTRLRHITRPTDLGASLRRLDRLITDGKIFTTKRRIPGGTVLIDGSGSMGWTRAQILQIVQAAPAATVAIYSGRHATGILRLLVKQGRIVRPALIDRPSGQGNIIDGPALTWLTQQPGPRLWISDGFVTGIHEVQHPALVAEVLRIQLTTHITRLDTLDEAIAFFDKLRRVA